MEEKTFIELIEDHFLDLQIKEGKVICNNFNKEKLLEIDLQKYLDREDSTDFWRVKDRFVSDFTKKLKVVNGITILEQGSDLPFYDDIKHLDKAEWIMNYIIPNNPSFVLEYLENGSWMDLAERIININTEAMKIYNSNSVSRVEDAREYVTNIIQCGECEELELPIIVTGEMEKWEVYKTAYDHLPIGWI